MSSLQYIPSSLAASIANQKILCIYATGSRPYAVTNADYGVPMGKATNYWVLHCVISQTESVEIDPSPAGANLSFVVIVSKKNYIYSIDAVKIVELTTNDLTVGGLINLLIAKKYDKYQFSQSGQGCRYWVYSVVALFKNEGKITDAAQIKSLNQAIQITWGEDDLPLPEHQQTSIVEGKFCTWNAVLELCEDAP